MKLLRTVALFLAVFTVFVAGGSLIASAVTCADEGVGCQSVPSWLR